MPAKVSPVMSSSNKNHAITAVVGGTRYIKLVTDAAAHFLHGELLEVLAVPTHRVRIPVHSA